MSFSGILTGEQPSCQSNEGTDRGLLAKIIKKDLGMSRDAFAR